MYVSVLLDWPLLPKPHTAGSHTYPISTPNVLRPFLNALKTRIVHSIVSVSNRQAATDRSKIKTLRYADDSFVMIPPDSLQKKDCYAFGWASAWENYKRLVSWSLVWQNTNLHFLVLGR